MALKPARQRAWPLRRWLILLVIACVLPAMVAATFLIYRAFQHDHAQQELTTIHTARALMQAVDRELSSAQGALQTLATSPSLASGDLAGFYAEATQALRGAPGINFRLSDASGQQLLNTLQPFGSPLPQHGNPEQLRSVFETGRPMVSDLYVGPVVKRPLISVDVPVVRDNRVVYDLSMGFSTDRLAEILRRQRLPADWVGSIFDSRGVIVARTHALDQYLGQQGSLPLVRRMRDVAEGSVDVVTLEGVPVSAGFSRSAVSDLTLAIGVPRSVLAKELVISIGLGVLGTILLLATGLVLAKLIGNRITGYLSSLVAPAMALGYGKPVSLPEFHLREADEIGQALVKASNLLRERTEERDKAEQAEREMRDAKQQLERSEAFLRGVFEETPDAVLLVAPTGRIVRASAQAETTFGYPLAQLLTMTVEDLLPPEVRQHHPALRQSFLASPRRRSMGADRLLYSRRADGSAFPIDVMLSPLKTDGEPLVIVTIRDMTERWRGMEAVRASEKRFRDTLEHAPIGMAIVAFDGRWIEVNTSLCDMLGYTKDELQHFHFTDLTHPDDLEIDLEKTKQLLDGEIRSYQMEKRYLRKDGSVVFTLLTRSVLRDANGQPLNFIAQIQDITQRKEAEERVATLNRRLAIATEAGNIGVWEWDVVSNALWWDERMAALYKLPPTETRQHYDMWRERVHPDDIARVEHELAEVVSNKAEWMTEFRTIWPDGRVRVIRANGIVTRDPAGRALRMTGVNLDITDSRQKEDAIRAALQEKETLLKELYHRVKNNLQVVASLFNLQARAAPGDAVRAALGDAADRVRAMTLVHEKLYQSGNLSSIALDEYISDLCIRLGNAAAAGQHGIALVTDAEPVDVGLELAIPLGLILNELISNSLKHGFPADRPGRITVRLKRQGENTMLLTVSDDGVGLPPGFNLTSSRTLGLKLVTALTAQLDGDFSIETRKGAHASLTFHLPSQTGS
ncbi:MAG TPA: PAS domain S-box protein [Burkholderiaceae bacterium]|jgi:PAS domain S-box-containing protein|nr:PAS domain S-box protein [Burkholderiaceae bacterium]